MVLYIAVNVGIVAVLGLIARFIGK